MLIGGKMNLNKHIKDISKLSTGEHSLKEVVDMINEDHFRQDATEAQELEDSVPGGRRDYQENYESEVL